MTHTEAKNFYLCRKYFVGIKQLFFPIRYDIKDGDKIYNFPGYLKSMMKSNQHYQEIINLSFHFNIAKLLLSKQYLFNLNMLMFFASNTLHDLRIL